MSRIPWYIKILVGIGGVGALYIAFDLLNIVQVFLAMVTVPLMFLYFVGLISHGTYEGIVSGSWLKDAYARITEARERLRSQEPITVSTSVDTSSD